MKKELLICAVTAFLATGCSDVQIEHDVILPKKSLLNAERTRTSLNEEGSATVYTFEEDMQLLSQMGYDTTDVYVYNDIYYVESKYRFTPEDLVATRSAGITTRLSSSGNRTLGLDYQHIKIMYSTGNEPSNVTYIEDAVDAWNNSLDCNLDFQIDSREYEEDYTCYATVDLSNSANAALITLSANNVALDQPHKAVHINTEHPHWAIVKEYSQGVYLLMHAIGELIGLQSITSLDSMYTDRSIMLDETLLSANYALWNSFSLNDISTLESMYAYPTPEFNYFWEPRSESSTSTRLKTGEYYTLTVEQIVGEEHDFNILYTLDEKSDGYEIEKLNNHQLEFYFNTPGSYTFTITPYSGDTNYESETFSIEAYTPATITYDWNPVLPNNSNKLKVNEIYNLSISGIPDNYDMLVGVTADDEGGVYQLTQVDKFNYQLKFTQTGSYTIDMVARYNNKQEATKSVVVSVISDTSSFSYSWDPTIAEGEYFALKTDYRLSVAYQNEYYDADPSYQYTVMLNGEAVTSSVVKSQTSTTARMNFSRPGEYEITVDVKYGEQVVNSYTIACTAVGAYVELSDISNGIELNTPYTFKYNYWHPEKERIYCSLEVTETAFDTSNINTIIENISENEIRVTFLDYGCYFITATATYGGVVEDQTIINITKLYQFEEHQVTLLSSAWNTLAYNLQLGTAATLPERVYCYVEQLKEERTDFFVERRIDRRFTYSPLKRIFDKGASMPVNLPEGSITTRPLNDSVDMTIYRTYTGVVYYPANGVRRVLSTVVDSLPRTKVDIPVNDLTGIFTGLE